MKMKRKICIVLIMCILCINGCQIQMSTLNNISIICDKTDGIHNNDQLEFPFEIVGRHSIDWDAECQKIAEYKVLDDCIELFLIHAERQQVMISWNGINATFNVTYEIPRGLSITPVYLDIDGDGSGELILSNCTGSGTGVLIEELHIFDLENAIIVDYVLLPSEVQLELKQLIDVNKVKNTLVIGDDTLSFSDDLLYEPIIGSILHYSFTNGITVSCGIALEYREYPGRVEYIGNLTARVNYSNGVVTLDNFQLLPSEQ